LIWIRCRASRITGSSWRAQYPAIGSLGSNGAFNAAHFKNAEYDRLVAGYIAALDPVAQRDAAEQIQRLLLEETPVITAYFYDWLSITSKRITGVRPAAAGQLFLDQTGSL
jgi:peptide/nickel transport system substrate-binding protein